MIGYHILCHGNFKQVAQLIESLYHEDDFFLIDIDDGKRPDTAEIEHFASRSNVHIHRDSNIGWGAGGTLRKTIKGALALLELDARWEYYVVLSGQDLPLKSNEHIKRSLREGSKERTNYIRACGTEVIDLASLPINNKGRKCMMWGDRGHTKIFAKPGAIDPQTSMYARTLVEVSEIGEKGEVYVGTVDPLLHRRRTGFFAQYPFHAGANWFNLHREFIEYMANDPFAYELYDVLRTTFIPDESYFQTYIMNSPFRDTVSPHYGRLILRPPPTGKVKVFDMGDWPVIESAPELYGRKFDAQTDQQIIDLVLKSRLEQTPGQQPAKVGTHAA